MNTEQTGRLEHRAAVHGALADVTRLRIVDLLAASDLSASELGRTLALPSNLLAHHLKVLESAGLLARRRSEGDGRRSYLSLTSRDAWLVNAADPAAAPVAASRVVFVCTANTARSHLAAALWRTASTVEATSAGTHPGERVNPSAVAVARRHDLDLPDVPPQRLEDTVADSDLVITVCDRAHEELEHPAWAHWSIPDPVAAGTAAAFEAAHDLLAERVGAAASRVVRLAG